MTTKTQEVETAHGSIEYETVECDYCNNDVAKEDGIAVLIDPYETSCNGAIICDAKHPKPREQKTMCPLCAESVFGYERTLTREYIMRMRFSREAAAINAIVVALILLVLLVLLL